MRCKFIFYGGAGKSPRHFTMQNATGTAGFLTAAPVAERNGIKNDGL